MATITLKNVTKRYGKVTALKNINLEIKNKEFFVVFGPAGAGKTTLLKTISGIEIPEEGEVYISNKNETYTNPAKRNIAMVFENYALYPNVTVYENIASPFYSPLYREKNKETIKKRVLEVAAMLKIAPLLDRLPAQLSNGQKQRVALGRCLVRNPNAFLLDEPIAHLDAKLRNLMRTEFREIQETLDTTAIYVTHDYMEALSLGDRICILNEGEIVQIGTRNEIFYTPVNEFVAKLVGEPEINIIDASVCTKNNGLFLNMFSQEIPLPQDVYNGLSEYCDKRVHVGIRGLDIGYSHEKKDGYLETKVYNVEPIGNKTIIVLSINDELVRIVVPNDEMIEIDSTIHIRIDIKKSIIFDQEGKFILSNRQF